MKQKSSIRSITAKGTPGDWGHGPYDEREIPEGRLLLLQARQELASVISSEGYALDGAALHRLGVVLRNIERVLVGAPLVTEGHLEAAS